MYALGVIVWIPRNLILFQILGHLFLQLPFPSNLKWFTPFFVTIFLYFINVKIS